MPKVQTRAFERFSRLRADSKWTKDIFLINQRIFNLQQTTRHRKEGQESQDFTWEARFMRESAARGVFICCAVTWADFQNIPRVLQGEFLRLLRTQCYSLLLPLQEVHCGSWEVGHPNTQMTSAHYTVFETIVSVDILSLLGLQRFPVNVSHHILGNLLQCASAQLFALSGLCSTGIIASLIPKTCTFPKMTQVCARSQ